MKQVMPRRERKKRERSTREREGGREERGWMSHAVQKLSIPHARQKVCRASLGRISQVEQERSRRLLACLRVEHHPVCVRRDVA
eukprot:1050334-Rhodomonas_salina.1